MRIDVHAHHLAPEYLACLERLRGPRERMRPAGIGSSLKERADMLKDCGVDLQVLSHGATMPYFEDKDAAVEAARLANDSNAEVARGFGGRFAHFGALPMPHVDASLAEAERCLDKLGAVGLSLGTQIGDLPLDDPAFEPLWAWLDQRQTVVLLHPQWRVAEPHLRDYDLAGMVGACFEDTLAALRILLSGLAERHANVRIIVPHLGGTLPLVYPRIVRRGKAHLLRRLWYDTANGYGPALACACQTLGADRMMLGTDFPYLTPLKEHVDYVQQAGLTPEDADTILHKTAAQLLGFN
jgi:predicted TIM-barrel fold metal-dependent hydrolase